MADITFGTNNEYFFHYLRDNMAHAPTALVQRKHHFAIVDEVDSVLIDDARTPPIISGPTPKGEIHQFDEYKPRVDRLHQRAAFAGNKADLRGQGGLEGAGHDQREQGEPGAVAASPCCAPIAACRRTAR